jgi:hypothetical protein
MVVKRITKKNAVSRKVRKTQKGGSIGKPWTSKSSGTSRNIRTNSFFAAKANSPKGSRARGVLTQMIEKNTNRSGPPSYVLKSYIKDAHIRLVQKLGQANTRHENTTSRFARWRAGRNAKSIANKLVKHGYEVPIKPAKLARSYSHV